MVDLRARASSAAADPTVRRTSASAAGGAAVGVVPAIFTFGLSIPVCAVIGGGAGLAAGTAVGSGAGAVGGAAVYSGYHHREELKRRAGGAVARLRESAGAVQGAVRERQ